MWRVKSYTFIHLQVIHLAILEERLGERREVLPIQKRLDTSLDIIIHVRVAHELVRDGEKDKRVVNQGHDSSGRDKIFQGEVEAIISRSDVDPGYATSDGDARSKNGKPHEGEESDDIFVPVKDCPNTEEE